MKRRTSLLVLLALAVPACIGDGSKTASPPSSASPGPLVSPVICQNGFPVPAGYEPHGTQQVPEGPTVMTRRFYTGPHDRHLVYTAGLQEDFYDDTPSMSGIDLSDGSTAALFWRAGDRGILFWYEPDACRQYTIGGEGFTSEGFLALLRRSGVLAGGPPPSPTEAPRPGVIPLPTYPG